MTTYYKATNMDGRDFRTDTIDYAGQLNTGESVRHPHPGALAPDKPSTYLSVSVDPASTLLGGSWPARLFRVEPLGPVVSGLSACRNKRAVQAMYVQEELESWRVFGPQGQDVLKVIERSSRLTEIEAQSLTVARAAARAAARDVARAAARVAARDAARGAARNAAKDAAGDAAWDAARNAAWDAAGDAAWDAVLAYLAQDLIPQSQFAVLAGPWLSVFPEETK